MQVSNKVYIFTNDSLYNYKTESLYDLPFGFIKELKTSYSSQKNLVDLLETPNFITGVSGASKKKKNLMKFTHLNTHNLFKINYYYEF